MTLLCELAVPAAAGAASVNDFVIAYGMVEAVELSNLDSVGSSIDCDRLNKALRDAYAELSSVQTLLSAPFAAVIDANLNRWMLILARYLLDTVRRRKDVTDDYNAVMAKLNELRQAGLLPNGQGPGQQFAVRASFGKSEVWTEQSLSSYNSSSFGVY